MLQAFKWASIKEVGSKVIVVLALTSMQSAVCQVAIVFRLEVKYNGIFPKTGLLGFDET